MQATIKHKRGQVEEITKAEIEAVYTGEITTHTHPAVGGGGLTNPLTSMLKYVDNYNETADDRTLVDKGTVMGYVNEAKRPYYSHTLLMSQAGASAPTVVDLETISGTTPQLNLIRISEGVYEYTLFSWHTNADIQKMWYSIGNGMYSQQEIRIVAVTGSVSTDPLKLRIYTSSEGSPADSILSSTPLEIRVYN